MLAAAKSGVRAPTPPVAATSALSPLSGAVPGTSHEANRAPVPKVPNTPTCWPPYLVMSLGSLAAAAP